MKLDSIFLFLFECVFLTHPTCRSRFASKAAKKKEEKNRKKKPETEKHLQN